ncbi:hypothetical protein N7471_005877 [Penicillium samsonianum]|uniref:uncharacterized protein n=1 Tax=Penicillium samsonianum TaxID=1882272 RepID=UPI002546EEB6|nr:uncharacterized protein N7471_005877 [Penicillium samsonianum]KAJ6139391.1 hypothetical protein N7471_005877 [Penicillium samsonianum]
MAGENPIVWRFRQSRPTPTCRPRHHTSFSQQRLNKWTYISTSEKNIREEKNSAVDEIAVVRPPLLLI